MAPKGTKGGKEALAEAPGPSRQGPSPPPEAIRQTVTPAYWVPETGPYWGHLRDSVQEALAAVANGDDEELQLEATASETALHQRFEQYMTQRPDEEGEEYAANDSDAWAVGTTDDLALEMAARLMDRTTGEPFDARFSPRLALLYLARAEWDYDLAVDTAIESLDIGDEELIQDAGDEPAQAPTTQVRPQTRALTAWQTQMLQHNPNVSRDPARVGTPAPGMFTITLAQPTGPPTTYTYTHTANFDWSSTEAVRALNKWRSQVFLRHLGPKQPARLHFHQLELSWLASYVRLVHGVRTGGGLDFDLSLLDMPVLVQQFNRHFQGRLIPGLTQVRPVRTIPSLRAELGRIDEVVRLTGMAVKKPAPTRGGKPRGPRGDGGGQGGRGGKGGGPGRGGMGGAGGAISV